MVLEGNELCGKGTCKNKNRPKTDKGSPISSRNARNRTPNFSHTECTKDTKGDNFPADSETTADEGSRRVWPQEDTKEHKKEVVRDKLFSPRLGRRQLVASVNETWGSTKGAKGNEVVMLLEQKLVLKSK